jgi:DNA-binding response OmpR family regulator
MVKETKAKRILIVDDEEDIRDILMFNLESEGYLIETAKSGESALNKLKEQPFDLVLLDIMMEGISGLHVAEKMRKDLKLKTPIVFLTAKVTENDMLTGFSLGADDYITKPFSIKEVIARSRAVMSRSKSEKKEETTDAPQQEKIIFDELEIDIERKEVTIAGEQVLLTKKEFEILRLLATQSGRIYSREEILTRVWKDETYVLERTVDVHITRLRKKIGTVGARITNRTGYGYCFK